MLKSFDRVGVIIKRVAMKTNNFRKVMCVCVLLSAFITFGSAKGKGGLFYYSNYGAKGLSDSQVICVSDESGKHLEPIIKYLFVYDKDNRVIKKEALKWDIFEDDWVSAYCLTFTYGDDSMITEYAKWNERKKYYDECIEKIVYEINVNKLVSCSHYKRDSSGESWRLESSCFVSTPIEALWNENVILAADAKMGKVIE